MLVQLRRARHVQVPRFSVRAVRPGRPYVSALRQGQGVGVGPSPRAASTALHKHRAALSRAALSRRGVGLSLCASMSVLRARAL